MNKGANKYLKSLKVQQEIKKEKKPQTGIIIHKQMNLGQVEN